MSGKTHKTWEEELVAYCRARGWPTPNFNVLSDRRGGRTAWSATVTVNQVGNIAARYWYDGQYIQNAKEDAAEVALSQLRNPSLTGAGQHQQQSSSSYRTQSRYGHR